MIASAPNKSLCLPPASYRVFTHTNDEEEGVAKHEDDLEQEDTKMEEE